MRNVGEVKGVLLLHISAPSECGPEYGNSISDLGAVEVVARREGGDLIELPRGRLPSLDVEVEELGRIVLDMADLDRCLWCKH